MIMNGILSFFNMGPSTLPATFKPAFAVLPATFAAEVTAFFAIFPTLPRSSFVISSHFDIQWDSHLPPPISLEHTGWSSTAPAAFTSSSVLYWSSVDFIFFWSKASQFLGRHILAHSLTFLSLSLYFLSKNKAPPPIAPAIAAYLRSFLFLLANFYLLKNY